VDSVAGLAPKAEIEGDIGDMTIGLKARLMSHLLRKISGPLRQSQAVLLFTNQLRMKIGVLYGNPEVTPGGKALKFHASVRLRLSSTTPMAQAGLLAGAPSRRSSTRTAARRRISGQSLTSCLGKG